MRGTKIIIAEFNKDNVEYFWRYHCNNNKYIRITDELINDVYSVYDLTEGCSDEQFIRLIESDEQAIIFVPLEREIMQKFVTEGCHIFAISYEELIKWEDAANKLIELGFTRNDPVFLFALNIPSYDCMDMIVKNYKSTSEFISTANSDNEKEGFYAQDLPS